MKKETEKTTKNRFSFSREKNNTSIDMEVKRKNKLGIFRFFPFFLFVFFRKVLNTAHCQRLMDVTSIRRRADNGLVGQFRGVYRAIGQLKCPTMSKP